MHEMTTRRDGAHKRHAVRQVARLGTHQRTREGGAAPWRDVTETKARMPMTTTELCRRCGFHPVSPRVGGYCSWDCHDADDEEHDAEDDEEAEQGAGADERAA